MKKITIICCVIISIIFSTSCGLIERKPSNLQLAQDMGQRIIDAFIAEDEDALYAVLSEKAQNFYRTKEQIQEAFDFIEGEIISYELARHTGGGSKAIEGGVVVHESISSIIRFIKTDTGHTYQIIASYVLIDKDRDGTLGISGIILSLCDESGDPIGGITVFVGRSEPR